MRTALSRFVYQLSLDPFKVRLWRSSFHSASSSTPSDVLANQRSRIRQISEKSANRVEACFEEISYVFSLVVSPFIWHSIGKTSYRLSLPLKPVTFAAQKQAIAVTHANTAPLKELFLINNYITPFVLIDLTALSPASYLKIIQGDASLNNTEWC